ncbi:bacterioferritin-associated ferredoxin [Inhella sp.]|uniref:(2Fe-2S)-binding protein n=1 Tax=Inhella sp. TaxID=1921806 RepID=UPI0035B4E3DF
MIVCLCHRVSDRQIREAQERGCADFEQLQDELLVGTACGACLDCAATLFAQGPRTPAARKTWQLQPA